MKANELMIGDWVTGKKWRENPFKLSRINDNGKYYYGITSDGTQVGPFLLEEIEPISLTSEILEKNGFERNPLWHHCDKDLDNYSISVQLGYANKIEYIKIAEKGKDNVIPSERTKLYLTHIKYVHQFQQALRLCGIDKTIEL